MENYDAIVVGSALVDTISKQKTTITAVQAAKEFMTGLATGLKR